MKFIPVIAGFLLLSQTEQARILTFSESSSFSTIPKTTVVSSNLNLNTQPSFSVINNE